MNPYEKIINTMRKEAGKAERTSDIRMCEMTSGTTCEMDGVELDAEDLIINADLKGKLKQGDKVLMTRVSEDTYAILTKVVSI